MASLEVSAYTAGAQIPANTAEQVAALFEVNYPTSHFEQDRTDDIAHRSDAGAINELLNEGRTLYVASASGVLAGFIEARTVDQPDGTYEQLAWIMTAAEFRGQRVASILHSSFIMDASLRAVERAPKPTLALLSVHEDNPAITIYEHWGYSVVERTAANKFLMIKSLPVKD